MAQVAGLFASPVVLSTAEMRSASIRLLSTGTGGAGEATRDGGDGDADDGGEGDANGLMDGGGDGNVEGGGSPSPQQCK